MKSWQVVLGEQSSIELGGALPKVETVQAQKIAAETIQARQRGIRQRKKQRARQHEEAAKEFMCKTRAQDSVLMASGKASMEGKRCSFGSFRSSSFSASSHLELRSRYFSRTRTKSWLFCKV